ncbi:MAG: hypothetical protein LBN23_06795, partial [Paludibacter sp.]|nr:hypothetical protein [Paludibacter sp.]
METRFSKKIAFYTCIPFFLFGIATIMISIPIPFFISLFLISTMFVLFVVGWIREFPRWAFYAIGSCILFSIYLTNIAVPVISKDVLGLWGLLPLFITVIIAILLKPSLSPLKQFFKNISKYPGLI